MLKAVTDIALEAGKIVKEGITSEKHVEYKGNVDLVTQYDLRVENMLKEKLSKLFPRHKIVAEETEADIMEREGDVIFIDPIDGTTNFVHGFPFISISIGVYSQKEGKFGVVYNPIMEELFTAEQAMGAFCNGKRIMVSKTGSLERSLVATGFPYVRDNLTRLIKVLEHTLLKTRGIRRAGSAALDLCYVAKGVFDLYYETKLQPWDISAGMIVVREAGGIVTNIHGLYHDLDSDSVLASNGLVHKEFMNMLNEIR